MKHIVGYNKDAVICNNAQLKARPSTKLNKSEFLVYENTFLAVAPNLELKNNVPACKNPRMQIRFRKYELDKKI